MEQLNKIYNLKKHKLWLEQKRLLSSWWADPSHNVTPCFKWLSFKIIMLAQITLTELRLFLYDIKS